MNVEGVEVPRLFSMLQLDNDLVQKLVLLLAELWVGGEQLRLLQRVESPQLQRVQTGDDGVWCRGGSTEDAA